MQRGRLLGRIGLSCLGVIGAGLVWYHSLKPSEPVALLERTYSARGQTDSISVASPDNYFGSQPTPSPLSLSSSHRRVDLSALVRLLSTGAAQNSALGYEGTVEQFPVSDDVAYSDLNDLFREDCVGRCLYVKGTDGNVTKLRLRSDSLLEVYDPTFDTCLNLGDRNTWIYLDDQGQVNSYGLGQESSHSKISDAGTWECKK